MPRLRTIAVTALAALFAPALFALDTQTAPAPANPADPGTLNYIEGTAMLNGQPVTRSADGQTALAPGQVLSTANSRAELLLTPGVYLRLGHDSAARMISPDITNTAVAIERGTAEVEVDQLFPENNIHVLVNHVPVQLVKTGLYEFNASNGTAMVFDGEAAVRKQDGKWVKIRKDHQLALQQGDIAKTRKFDESAAEQTGLYRWSSLRSDYLAEANEQLAGQYGAGYAPGWYWDPYMWNYTYLGMYPFYSPFGWGFYPLGWGGGWYGPGFYGGGYGGGRFVGPHGPVNLPRGGFGGSAHAGSGFRANAFRSGGEMGGFHGGGGFGGFHGGGSFGGGHGR